MDSGRVVSNGECARLRELDWLMLAVVGLCCLGLVMAVSIDAQDLNAGAQDAMRAQGTKLCAGLLAFTVCAAAPLPVVKRLAWPLFGATAALVLAAILFGPNWNGAHRWLSFAGYSFQPVDLARPATILLTAVLIERSYRRLTEFRAGFVAVMAPVGVLALLLALQPDFGNALLCCAIVVAMAVAAGVRLRWFALVGSIALPALALRIASKSYALERITGFLTNAPDQVRQSITSIGSGGLWGTGIGDGWMKMGYVPEARNDFVFAVIGEELGLLGTSAVVGLYVLIGYVGFRLVLQLENPFYRYLVFGCTMSICLQAMINLMVTTGMAPAKGIDLPLVSSGGTNLMTTLGVVGLIGNAARAGLLEKRLGR